MRWEKALREIKDALKEGANVGIRYSRSDGGPHRFADVEDVDGNLICTPTMTLDEQSTIIYEVLVDYYFGSRWGDVEVKRHIKV